MKIIVAVVILSIAALSASDPSSDLDARRTVEEVMNKYDNLKNITKKFED
jgi:hypothetical protein